MVKIKLARRQGPCLSVEIAQVYIAAVFYLWGMLLSIEMMSLQPTLTGASRTVTHEVPVSVVPERFWPDYQEPNMPDIDVSLLSSLRLTHTHCSLQVSIYLPPLKLLKNITDRMKTMSNYVVSPYLPFSQPLPPFSLSLSLSLSLDGGGQHERRTATENRGR